MCVREHILGTYEAYGIAHRVTSVCVGGFFKMVVVAETGTLLHKGNTIFISYYTHLYTWSQHTGTARSMRSDGKKPS